MYYNSDGMVRDSSSASLLDLTKENKTDIDLTLTEMRSVSGNIVLPSGVAPSEVFRQILLFPTEKTVEK